MIGAELSNSAIVELFEQLKIVPKVESKNDLIKYSAKGIDIFVGDIFNLTHNDLGVIDAVRKILNVDVVMGINRNHRIVNSLGFFFQGFGLFSFFFSTRD